MNADIYIIFYLHNPRDNNVARSAQRHSVLAADHMQQQQADPGTHLSCITLVSPQTELVVWNLDSIVGQSSLMMDMPRLHTINPLLVTSRYLEFLTHEKMSNVM